MAFRLKNTDIKTKLSTKPRNWNYDFSPLKTHDGTDNPHPKSLEKDPLPENNLENEEVVVPPADEPVLTGKELREKMLADRKARILAGRKTEETKVLSAKELREKMLQERKEKILAARKPIEEIVKETPIEEIVAPAKPEEPVGDGWTYIGGDKETANKRRMENWKDTGITDESVWNKNENDLQSKYDGNFEEFSTEAQTYRDAQVIEQDRSDWVEHWSKADWKPSWQRKYGSMEDWIGGKIVEAGDTESAQGWEEEFKNAKNQQEFLKWAEINAPNFWEQFTGNTRGGGGSGSRRGKTSWSGSN